ncbi:MAG: hypothetical protein M1833_004366 [Piccolia ochrophora]|nr:MAG: hypothetical protein M1833_004366 [Piccolia ochrophora]
MASLISLLKYQIPPAVAKNVTISIMASLKDDELTYIFSSAYAFTDEGILEIKRLFETTAHGKEACCTYDKLNDTFQVTCGLEVGDECFSTFFDLAIKFIDVETRPELERPARVTRIDETRLDRPALTWALNEEEDPFNDAEFADVLLGTFGDLRFREMQKWRPQEGTDLKLLLQPVGLDVARAFFDSTECYLDVKYSERVIMVAGPDKTKVARAKRKLTDFEKFFYHRDDSVVCHRLHVRYDDAFKVRFATLQSLRNKILKTTLLAHLPTARRLSSMSVSRLLKYDTNRVDMIQLDTYEISDEKLATRKTPPAKWAGFRQYKFRPVGDEALDVSKWTAESSSMAAAVHGRTAYSAAEEERGRKWVSAGKIDLKDPFQSTALSNIEEVLTTRAKSADRDRERAPSLPWHARLLSKKRLGGIRRTESPEHVKAALETAEGVHTELQSKAQQEEQARLVDQWFSEMEAPRKEPSVEWQPVKNSEDASSQRPNTDDGTLLDFGHDMTKQSGSDSSMPSLPWTAPPLVPLAPARKVLRFATKTLSSGRNSSLAGSKWSDSSSELTIKEKKKPVDEVDSRTYKRTMGQQKSNPSRNGNSGVTNEDRPTLQSILSKSLKLAKSHMGEVKVDIDIGRILMQNVPEKAAWRFLPHEWDEVLKPDDPQEPPPTPIFTNMLTTSVTDMDLVLNARNSDGSRLFADEVKTWSVTYEFACSTKDGEQFIIEIDGEDHEGDLPTVKAMPRHFGTIYLHHPKWNWDAKCSITGTRFLLTDSFSETARQLLQNLWVPAELTNLRFTTALPGKFPRIESVVLKRQTQHPPAPDCTTLHGLTLCVTEVQDLVVQHHPSLPGAIRVFAVDPAAMIDAYNGTRLWYEVSLRSSPEVEAKLKENVEMEIGEEAKWNPDDVLNAQEVKTLTDVVEDVIRSCECVGEENVGPAVKFAARTIQPQRGPIPTGSRDPYDIFW